MTCKHCRNSLVETMKIPTAVAGNPEPVMVERIVYHCRALPPSVVVTADQVQTMFPIMRAGGWCGFHRWSLRKLLSRK